MIDLKLNLGRFTDCIVDSSGDTTSRHGVRDDQELYIVDYNGVKRIVSGGEVTVELFDVGDAVENSRINQDDARRLFLTRLEMKIFELIGQMVAQLGVKFQSQNLQIPVSKIEMFDDDKSKGCYGWVKLGIILIK